MYQRKTNQVIVFFPSVSLFEAKENAQVGERRM